MHLISTLITATLFSLLSASPVITDHDKKTLLARLGRGDGGDPENAIDVRLNGAGWENLANDNAWAMLCPKPPAPRQLQRLAEENEDERHKVKGKHYRNSGAAAQPFKSPNEERYNLRMPKLAPNEEPWDSAEEMPYESANVPGEPSDTKQRKTFIFPGPMSEQRMQGVRLTQSLDKAKVGLGSWYHITGFDNCNKPYCDAFNRDDPRICEEKDDVGDFDPAKYAAVRLSNPGQRMAFGNIGGKGSMKRGATDSQNHSISPVIQDVDIDHGTDKSASIQKRASSDDTLESEIVLDDLPAITHD